MFSEATAWKIGNPGVQEQLTSTADFTLHLRKHGDTDLLVAAVAGLVWPV